MVIGADCEILLKARCKELAMSQIERDLDEFARTENLELVLQLYLADRVNLIELDQSGLSVEQAQDAGISDAVVDALEALHANRQNIDGLVANGSARLTSPSGGRPSGRWFKTKQQISKRQMKAVRQEVIASILQQHKPLRPYLTPRTISEAWRLFKSWKQCVVLPDPDPDAI